MTLWWEGKKYGDLYSSQNGTDPEMIPISLHVDPEMIPN